MKDFLKGSLVVGCLVLIIFFMALVSENHKEKIRIFLIEERKAVEVISVEKCVFDRGPWWYTDLRRCDVYFAKYKDSKEQNKTMYVAFDLFGMHTSD